MYSFPCETEGFQPLVISVLQLESATSRDNVTQVEWVTQLLGMSERIPCLDLKCFFTIRL